MAFRIHDSVVRGELDNRVKGIVRGRVWLEGRAAPIELALAGNAQPDLAGCLLRFVNPRPREKHPHLDALNPIQRGTIGDLTASRKVRVPAVPMKEFLDWPKEKGPPPSRGANCLYLEWFSEANGRVVIESADFELTLSAPEWRLTPDEETERQREAEAGMQGFLGRLTAAIQEQERRQKPPDAPWNEHDYEGFLKTCDARTDKYAELLDKYGDSDDARDRIAAEMGWGEAPNPGEAEDSDDDRMSIEELNAIAEAAANDPEPEPDPHREGIDSIRTQDGAVRHPLQHRCSEFALRLLHAIDELGPKRSMDEDLEPFIGGVHTTAAKLAGALNSIARGAAPPDPAFTVACLKRALNHLHQALSGMDAVSRKRLLPDALLAEARGELMAVREGILALMNEFRGRPHSP